MNQAAGTSRTALFLTPDGTHREPWRKAFTGDGYRVDFVSNGNDVSNLLANLKPKVFIQDWNALDDSQSRQLATRLSKLAEYVDVCRIVLVEAITPQSLSMANDISLARLVSVATPAPMLLNTVNMAVASHAAHAKLHQVIADIRSGQKVYEQKEIDSLVETAFTEWPNDADVRIEHANLQIRKGDLTAARKVGEEILAQNPTNVRAMNLVARTLMKDGKFDEALNVLHQADALSPSNPGRLALIGDAFFGKGDIGAAVAAYEEAMKQDPDNAAAAEGLGILRLSEGDADAALALFSGSLSEEEAVGFFNNAGVAAAKVGKLEEAIRLYETALAALKTAKNRPSILYNLALAHRRTGNINEAIKAIKRAVKMSPEFEKASRLLKSLDKG